MPDTPVVTIDGTGIHVPDFPTILNYFQNAYRGIYGSDVYLEPDGQDGQFLGILAAAVNDANAMAVACYNAYSPATAQGTGLSSNVKINGIARKIPSRSTCDIVLGGQAATVITNGTVMDENNISWNLPPMIEIPYNGVVTATALCSILGDIKAPVGSIRTIINTQPGWQTAENLVPATPGLPIEDDATLRRRQSVSTAIPAQGLLEALVGSLWTLPDVRQIALYENTLWVPDVNGIPGHSYALVIDGGVNLDIATMLMEKKGGGTGTYGDQIFTLTNQWGIPHKIAFWRPVTVPITWKVTLDTFPHYTTNTEAAIAQALSDWTNGLGIGTSIRIKRAYLPANLNGGAGSETFEPLNLEVARDGNPPTDADVAIGFREQPVCVPGNVQFRYPDLP